MIPPAPVFHPPAADPPAAGAAGAGSGRMPG